VDLVEQDAKYVAKARTNITDKRLANFWCMGLQDFTYVYSIITFIFASTIIVYLIWYRPVAGRYDVIWIQWVIGHLPDDDMVAFLAR
jgi:protein N-terminal methyltransferase